MTSRKRIHDMPLHRVYHENSKNLQIDPITKSEMPSEWLEIEYKSYDHVETTPLPRLDTKGDETVPLHAAIGSRRSPASFDPVDITRDELAQLLTKTAGITGRGDSNHEHRRAYPSGGARYPLEFYPVVLRSDHVERGVYHYNVRANSLERLPQDDTHRYEGFLYGSVEGAALLLFVTAKLDRTTRKYGERGYRYANLEAGHAMQNLCLMAESLGLACRPYGGFLENEADDYLRLNDDETTLYIGVVGKPAAQSTAPPNEEHDENQ